MTIEQANTASILRTTGIPVYVWRCTTKNESKLIPWYRDKNGVIKKHSDRNKKKKPRLYYGKKGNLRKKKRF